MNIKAAVHKVPKLPNNDALVDQASSVIVRCQEVGRSFELANLPKSERSSASTKVHWVLKNINLNVHAGQFVAILGESGGGKSTLLNLMAALDRPDEGQISIVGTNTATLTQAQATELRRAKIGFVFQAFHLLNHLSAWQNVALPLLLAGAPETTSQARARDLLDQLGLGKRTDAQPAQLSGGEQQRVALARALIHSPALLLADEPTGNLDPISARPALELIRQQCATRQTAVVMVTHSESAARLADATYRLENGCLTQQ
jgi:putative ABC transport system ATP-binding protein